MSFQFYYSGKIILSIQYSYVAVHLSFSYEYNLNVLYDGTKFSKATKVNMDKWQCVDENFLSQRQNRYISCAI